MKIVPFLHRQAPELCFFLVNGFKFQEKPMLGKQVNWYNVMYGKDALHPITAIRKKHFKRAVFTKYAEIKIVFPEQYSWLNVEGKQHFNSYSDFKIALNEYMKKKHPSYFDANIRLYDGSLMPQPKLFVKFKTAYICK